MTRAFEIVEIINFSVVAAGVMVMLLGLLLAVSSEFMERWLRRYFVVFFLLMTVYTMSDLVGQVATIFMNPVWINVTRWALFVESLVSSMLLPLITRFLFQCTGVDWRRSRIMYAVLLAWVAYVILLIVTQSTTMIYHFTEEGDYQRGPWYPALLVAPVVSMLLNLAALIKQWNKLSGNERVAFLAYLILPTIGMVIQMTHFGLYTIVFGTELAGLIMFTFILREQMEEYARRAEESAQQQISIMMLQMRPHFICNTLTSIYYLCGSDAKKAQRVVGHFTDYLQRNFHTVTKMEPVPFAEELEHTKAYLEVEKARFDEQLSVTFDTPCVDFKLPALTLQPIVENAVKYGVLPDGDPLSITVRTARTAEGVVTAVEDTGPGYAPTEDDEPHIALRNIRRRLAMMCGGTLEILPKEGGGTVVRVFVPDAPEQSDRGS
ncbi:MAG: histidine kinase [Oscillospiraceae bacterium]|nr:histidine kinase [Oscillospiraceae bacterium]